MELPGRQRLLLNLPTLLQQEQAGERDPKMIEFISGLVIGLLFPTLVFNYMLNKYTRLIHKLVSATSELIDAYELGVKK